MDIQTQEPPKIEEKKCCLLCCSCSGWKVVVCVVVGLLVVAGAVCAGYFLGRKSLSPKELLVPPEPITTQIPIDNGPAEIEVSPTPEVPADWKTYKNEKYGFEFKYPSVWKNDNETYSDSSGIIVGLSGDKKAETGEAPGVVVSYFNNPEKVSLEKYEEYYYRGETGGMGLNLYFSNDKLINISGVNARYQENNVCEPVFCSTIVIPYKDKIFAIYIYGENREPIYDQILSTFKFLD